MTKKRGSRISKQLGVSGLPEWFWTWWEHRTPVTFEPFNLQISNLQFWKWLGQIQIYGGDQSPCPNTFRQAWSLAHWCQFFYYKNLLDVTRLCIEVTLFFLQPLLNCIQFFNNYFSYRGSSECWARILQRRIASELSLFSLFIHCNFVSWRLGV